MIPLSYQTIKQFATEEIVIKKSRFIANSFPIQNEEEALEHIKDVNKEHYKATHNTLAYVIGIEGDIKRFNDDGEPSGTAGKPILECITNKNLTNILVIVTRYFGGIKLGAGGLVRAYSTAASLVIDKSIPVTIQYCALLEIKCDYFMLGKIETYVNNNELIKLKAISYEDNVKFHIFVPEEMEEDIKYEIVDMANGKVKITSLNKEYISWEG